MRLRTSTYEAGKYLKKRKTTMKTCLIFVMVWQTTTAVLYSLNASDYARMPPLYSLDDYDSCMKQQNPAYCVIDGDLNTQQPSELMDMIRNYSEYTVKHFNRTQIHRGVCIKQSCQKYVSDNFTNPEETLKICLNESLWSNYGLEVDNVHIQYCESEKHDPIDGLDICVLIIYIAIVASNIVGSLYHMCIGIHNNDGNRVLLCFSIFKNWRRLVAPGGSGPDPRLERLKLFNGLRTMTMICVFFSHTVLMMALSYTENPLYIETAYEDPAKQILFNGTLVTFTFFTMSSFLLAYNLEVYAEKKQIDWTQIPKGILLRWLRLTPTYALIIATVCTWMRHLGGGPLWRQVVTSETTACRKYYWAHLLYINNYIYEDNLCFPQSWYLAADTQLFVVGLVLCVLMRTPRSRKVVLSLMLGVSFLIPGLHTYLQDLDAVVIQTPESYRNVYATNPTFRYLYTSGHANMATYIMGLSGGFLAYNWQQQGYDLSQYRNYRILYWSVFPTAVIIILSGGLFYIDGVRAHIGYRVVYAMLYKPLFQAMVLTLVMGIIFKYESVYRGIIEWRGWAWSGRVSYAGFLLHSLFQRGLVGSQRRPTYMTDYYVLVMLAATIFLTFATAAMFWVTVEGPICQLIKIMMSPGGERGEKLKKNVTISTIEVNGLQSKL